MQQSYRSSHRASYRFATSTLAAAILVACYVPTTVAAEGISDNEIRIGYLADMSGVYRDPIGPLGEDAIHMAIEDMGGSVNGANIVVFSADDRNSPDVGSSVVREWIDERNVDMVTGLVASSVTLAAVSCWKRRINLGWSMALSLQALPTSTVRPIIFTGFMTPGRCPTVRQRRLLMRATKIGIC